MLTLAALLPHKLSALTRIPTQMAQSLAHYAQPPCMRLPLEAAYTFMTGLEESSPAQHQGQHLTAPCYFCPAHCPCILRQSPQTPSAISSVLQSVHHCSPRFRAASWPPTGPRLAPLLHLKVATPVPVLGSHQLVPLSC